MMLDIERHAPTTGKVLVLGASGQMGAALLRRLGPLALPAARRRLQPTWLEMDLEQVAQRPFTLDGLMERHDIRAMVCAAGATDVERCQNDAAWAQAANYRGPELLARAAKDVPFVFVSTDYVFDGQSGPYAEQDQVRPLSVYGRTKAQGEQAVLQAHPNALVLRTTTVYGPDPQEKNFLYSLRRLLGAGTPMRVPHDQLSTPTHVDDLAAATLALLNIGASGIFHVAGPDWLSRYDFAVQACGVLGLDPTPIESVATAVLKQAAERPLRGGLQTSKLVAALPQLAMRGVAAGVRAWKAAQEANP